MVPLSEGLFILFLLIVAAFIVEFFISCLGAYYLFSKHYSVFSLIIAAIVFLAIVFYVANKFADGSVILAFGYSSLPFSVFATVFDSSIIYEYFFLAGGLIINYLSIFAVINSVHKILGKIFQYLARG